MVTIVIIINTLIALINFYIAWRVWKLRPVIANAAKAILAADRNTHNVLYGAPIPITQGKKGIAALRKQHQGLVIKLQQFKQVLLLLGFGQRIWQTRNPMARQSKYANKARIFPLKAKKVK